MRANERELTEAEELEEQWADFIDQRCELAVVGERGYIAVTYR